MSDSLHSFPLQPSRRSFWRRVADRLLAFIGGNTPATPPERSVAFTIAVISLGAKLAKADGEVRKSEVNAFRRIFIIPRSEEKAAARVFDLARETVAGYQAWARRIARLFPAGDPILEDVMEGLYIIAAADGTIKPEEYAFLDEVSSIFGLDTQVVMDIRNRHDPNDRCLPCEILGVAPDTPLTEARRKWRDLIREAHPDRAIARGLPPEAVRLAASRTRSINEAWQHFRDNHAENRAKAL